MRVKIKKYFSLCLMILCATILIACAGNGVHVSARGDMTVGAGVGSK